jgi:3D (Asp-Asp-Asp) domain-containing protein
MIGTAWAGEPPELENPPAVAMQDAVIHDEKIAEPLLDEVPPPKIVPNNPRDHSKVADDAPAKLALTSKIKECCGYPIGLKESYWLSFYWLAYESEFASLPYDTDIYTRQGWFIGRFPSAFVHELNLEGSGILADGRILNYDGSCNYGMGSCFKTLELAEHPLGAGVQRRKLVPFRSIAVDPRYIPIGATVYVPELVGIDLPDGTKHDGCLRADDMGGAIKGHKLDFFVESYNNFKFIADSMWWHVRATPTIDEPRCEYLRVPEVAVRDRTNDHTDWVVLHLRGLQAKLAERARTSLAKTKRNRLKAQAWIKRHYGPQKGGKTQVAKRP